MERHRPGSVAVIPPLPVDPVRAAVAAGDWDAAAALLDAHDAQVRDTLRRLPATEARDAWADLLAQQHALHGELATLRDDAALTLQRMSRQRRGAGAYADAAA